MLAPSSWERILDAVVGAGAGSVGEVTCEVNPEDVTDDMMGQLASSGFNRLSLGIQSMDEGDQNLLGRCPADVNRRAIGIAGRHFDNLSFDVLLGVPGRALPSLERTLDELIECGPNHFSVYCLEPGGDVGAAVDRFFETVDPERSADEYLAACARLKAAGYRHYEVSSFAKPGRESAHNRVYWDGGDYIGLGPAAHSCLGGRRFSNPPSLDAYLETAALPGERRWVFDDAGPEQVETERLMLSLRTDRGVAVEALSCPQAVINAILEGDLAGISEGRLRLTDRGYLLLNEVVLRLAG